MAHSSLGFMSLGSIGCLDTFVHWTVSFSQPIAKLCNVSIIGLIYRSYASRDMKKTSHWKLRMASPLME